jgi:cbb3-type cytochrome oxidase maturation protein
MSVLFIAVPVALVFAGSAVLAFFWAARGGQLDDLETPPLRMLHDEAKVPATERTRAMNSPE